MRFIPLLAAAALFAVPAGAIDLTGTWVGTFNCTEFDGVKFKYTYKDEILLITQVGNVLNIDWERGSYSGHRDRRCEKARREGRGVPRRLQTRQPIPPPATRNSPT